MFYNLTIKLQVLFVFKMHVKFHINHTLFKIIIFLYNLKKEKEKEIRTCYR